MTMPRNSLTQITGASTEALREKTVAVLGFGAQGGPHAQNLRDSGIRVVVAQRRESRRYDEAVAAGFSPLSIADAVAPADVIIFALPDEAVPAIFEVEIRARLRGGQALGFIHGYNIHYRRIAPPANVDVILVAPKAQGRAVRAEFLAGRGVPGLIAVAHDASGCARQSALAWAAGLGCHRAAIFETTFKDETETDLFGEQAVLCGGVTSLIKAAFDTLTDAGYPPELAYFECCHELKLLVDLIHEGGITYMRERISNTARYGDLTRGPRIIDHHVRAEMRKILAEIQSGAFAAEWAAENAAGRPRFSSLTQQDRAHALELVGLLLRDLMHRPTAS